MVAHKCSLINFRHRLMEHYQESMPLCAGCDDAFSCANSMAASTGLFQQTIVTVVLLDRHLLKGLDPTETNLLFLLKRHRVFLLSVCYKFHEVCHTRAWSPYNMMNWHEVCAVCILHSVKVFCIVILSVFRVSVSFGDYLVTEDLRGCSLHFWRLHEKFRLQLMQTWVCVICLMDLLELNGCYKDQK